MAKAKLKEYNTICKVQDIKIGLKFIVVSNNLFGKDRLQSFHVDTIRGKLPQGESDDFYKYRYKEVIKKYVKEKIVFIK